MSASGDPAQTAREAADLIEEYGGLGPFVRNFGVGGILFALIQQVIAAIGAAGETLLAPWRALADGIATLVSGTLGSGVGIIDAGGDTAIVSLTDGLAAQLGPFAFPFAIAVVMLAVFVFVRAIGRIEFSPLIFIRRRLG